MNHFEILFRDRYYWVTLRKVTFLVYILVCTSTIIIEFYHPQKGKPIIDFITMWNWRHPKRSILRQSEHGAFSVIPNNVQCVIFSEGKAYQRHNIMDHSHWKLNVLLSSLQRETYVKLSKWNPSIEVDSRELHPTH